MEPIIQLTEKQYADVESQVNYIVANNSKSLDEIYSALGRSIYFCKDLELGYINNNKLFIKTPSDNDFLTAKNALDLLSDHQSINKDAAIEGGKRYFARLKENIKKEICTNDTIRDFFTGETALDKALRIIIPIILTALGITIMNPFIMAAIIAILVILLKVGYTTFCEI
jgi:hypothetical protein